MTTVTAEHYYIIVSLHTIIISYRLVTAWIIVVAIYSYINSYLNLVVLCISQQVQIHPITTNTNTTNNRPDVIPSPIALYKYKLAFCSHMY